MLSTAVCSQTTAQLQHCCPRPLPTAICFHTTAKFEQLLSPRPVIRAVLFAKHRHLTVAVPRRLQQFVLTPPRNFNTVIPLWYTRVILYTPSPLGQALSPAANSSSLPSAFIQGHRCCSCYNSLSSHARANEQLPSLRRIHQFYHTPPGHLNDRRHSPP